MMNDYRNLWVYLGIIFMFSWGIAMGFVLFPNVLIPIFGQLNLTHPLTILALYSPSIAGLYLYYSVGGFEAVKGILVKLIPRKQDLWWFPMLFLIWVVFAIFVHFGSLLLNNGVPEITLTLRQVFVKALWNFFRETGLLGGLFGWVGFLLPFLQGKLRNNIYGGLLTGLIFGLWVLPGYLLSSFGETSSYVLYVIQLMTFFLFTSYYFNATKGNLTCYLFMFWLTATGAHIQLYYFNAKVQILQIVFFIFASMIVHVVFKKMKMDDSLQIFPDFIQNGVDETLNQHCAN